MKAGIFIDDYKFPAFKKALDDEGFIFSKTAGITKGTLTLIVYFDQDNREKLKELVNRVNSECSRGVN